MGFGSDFLTGFAQLLATAGVGAYSEDAAYADDQTGITFGKLPPSPLAAIALSDYPVTDDPTLSDSVIGLQAIVRANSIDRRDTADLADAIFDQLQGLTGATLSTGIQVTFAERHGGAWLGQDDLNRWERSDNYYVTLWRPSPHRN